MCFGYSVTKERLNWSYNLPTGEEMKKVKNIVIGGIQQKVFNLVLVTIVLMVAAYTAVILYQGRNLELLTEETNLRQKEAIAAISEETMSAVVGESLTVQTQMAAALVDDLFAGLSSTVQILSDSAAELLKTPEIYSARPFSLPDPATDGTVTMQLVGETGRMPEDLAVTEKLGLLANLSDLMVSLYRNEGTSSVYIAVPEGYMLCVDDKAGARVDSQGNYLTIPIRERPWYLGAAQSDSLFFTDVLQDTFTGEIGITCSMPVRQNGRLVAVVAADMFLNEMAQAVESSGDAVNYTCIINDKGHVLFSPMNQGTLSARAADSASDLRFSEQEDLAAFIRDALGGMTGIRELNLDGDLVYLSGAPVETLGWTVVSVVDKAATERPTVMMEQQVDEVLADAAVSYNQRLNRSKQTILIMLLLILVLGCIAANRVSRQIVRPLDRMTSRVGSLSGEDLQFKMEPEYRTGDEIEILAESFATLSARTLHYIDQVKQVTAEKERIGAELNMATAIQASQLPRLFPAFPNRPEFDIYATMDPAKEVGGDFYDFFLVDDDHIAMVLADVSGKGVPAALFMMVSRVLIKSHLQSGESPAQVLAAVNNQLCDGNDPGFFVTVWLAVLEISTGRGVAANAGHEHPALRRAGGEYALVVYRHSPAVAVMDGISFREHSFELHPGDSVFVFTDGVSEATNAEEELFGTDRMLDALNRQPDADPMTILRNVKEDIDAFVGDAEQFDDITMLCLKYVGPDAVKAVRKQNSLSDGSDNGKG